MVDFGDFTVQKMYTDTHWIYYCLCEGCGVGGLSPMVLSDVKELCLHTQSGMDVPGGPQGFCHSAASCLCISSHCALPPAKGSYPCVCCGKEFGAIRTEGSEMAGMFDHDNFMKTPTWLIYFLCEGCGVHSPGATGQVIASQFKELCCAGATVLESPMSNGVLCSDLTTFLCIYEECAMPPRKGNPKLACCTKKMNSDHSEAPNQAPGKPEQIDVQEMMANRGS